MFEKQCQTKEPLHDFSGRWEVKLESHSDLKKGNFDQVQTQIQ